MNSNETATRRTENGNGVYEVCAKVCWVVAGWMVKLLHAEQRTRTEYEVCTKVCGQSGGW